MKTKKKTSIQAKTLFFLLTYNIVIILLLWVCQIKILDIYYEKEQVDNMNNIVKSLNSTDNSNLTSTLQDIDNPYIINEDKLSIGSKVKLGNDTYIVYDLKDNIKLMSTKTLNNLLIENVLDYLNNEFFEKLDYKDLLQDTTIYTGYYNNKENDLTKEKITKKIGIPNILDIKFDNEVTNYYLPNKINTFALIYNNPIIYGDAKKEHETRYTITLSKDIIKNLIKENDTYIYGDGAK